MNSSRVPQPVLEKLRSWPHEVLFATVSGAHLYGFESLDSDWDLRGAHIAPLRDVLTMSPPAESVELMEKNSDPEIDIVTHDVLKYFRMLVKNNGYVLEQVFSPLVVAGEAELPELRAIARRCMCKQHRHHFFHFGIDQWKAASATPTPTVKSLLYTYRPLLAGIRLMRTGEVESNLPRLNDDFRIPQIDDLIARKLAGDERMKLAPAELEAHRPQFDRLCVELDEARDRSSLPEEPGGRDELDDFLVRLRTRGRLR